MKKLLFIIALLYAPSICWAQCNGVFPNNTVCGNVTGTTNTPRAIPLSSLPAALPGGTNGQIQYNNSGAFGGFTMSQDCTTNTSTGVITCTELQNIPVTTTGANTNDVLYYNGTGWLHNTVIAVINTACTLAPSTCVSLFGYANPVWWGADPTGVADSTSAFNSSQATGLPIRWPIGKFLILAPVSYTLPNAQASFIMSGAGPNATTLYWPNASGGITVTAGNLKNNFSIRDLKLTTAQVASGIALYFIGPGCNSGCEWPSDITNVVMQGDDFSTTSAECWGYGIWLHNWGAVNLYNVISNGSHGAPGSSGCGTGLLFEGDTATSSYATILNIISSHFNFHGIGVDLGSYWQGVTINQTNFNGEEGTACVNQQSSASGVQVLLTVTNSQFNCAGQQIALLSPVLSSTLIGNTITLYGNNNLGFSCQSAGCSGLIFQGNIINQAVGGFTGQYGIVWNGTGGVVMGNWINNITNGINFQSGSTDTVAALNSWQTVTTKITDNGAGNSVGTCTTGCMTNVIP